MYAYGTLQATPGFSPRSGHGVVVVDGTVYVIAGWVNNKCVHDLWASVDGGASFAALSNTTWNCGKDDCGKFDFWPVVWLDSSVTKIATIGDGWEQCVYAKRVCSAGGRGFGKM